MSKYQVSKGIWELCAPTEEMSSVHEVDQALSPSDGSKIRVASFLVPLYLDDVPLYLKVGRDFWDHIQSKTDSRKSHENNFTAPMHVIEPC